MWDIVVLTQETKVSYTYVLEYMFYMHSSSCGINYIGKVQVPIGQGCRGTHTVPAFLKKKVLFKISFMKNINTNMLHDGKKMCIIQF